VLDIFNIGTLICSLVKIRRQLGKLESNDSQGLLANHNLLSGYITVSLAMLVASLTQLSILLFRYNFKEEKFRQPD